MSAKLLGLYLVGSRRMTRLYFTQRGLRSEGDTFIQLVLIVPDPLQ